MVIRKAFGTWQAIYGNQHLQYPEMYKKQFETCEQIRRWQKIPGSKERELKEKENEKKIKGAQRNKLIDAACASNVKIVSE